MDGFDGHTDEWMDSKWIETDGSLVARQKGGQTRI